ncbi:MAG: TraB/GumN family protein [Defluviitaleaceae bacterium]|nr:TraB/GumN family protein [Defluviitaleaceae bacterium]
MKKYLVLAILLILAACGRGDGEREAPDYAESTAQSLAEAESDAPLPSQAPPATVEDPDAFSGRLTRIEYGENVAYLLNAPIYGVAEWFPFASYVREAMSRADVFVFWEGEYSDEELAANNEYMQGLFFLPDGVTLESILPDDILQNLLVQLPTFGVPLESVNNWTPHTLMMEMERAYSVRRSPGSQNYSVQQYIREFAEESSEPLFGISDIYAISDLLFDVPLEQQIEALRDFPSLTEVLWAEESPLGRWLDFAIAENPRIYADRIEELLTQTAEPTTFFVATMFSHDDEQFMDILLLLEEKGFELDALWQSTDEILRPLPLIFDREARIMWIGNSLTFMGETPSQFNDIALNNGVLLWTTLETRGGVGLDTLADGAIEQLKQQQYDFVIIQDNGSNGDDVWRVSRAARMTGAIPVLFNPAVWYDDWPDIEWQIEQNAWLQQLAAVSGALLVDMPLAWIYATELHPTAELFRPNASHPTDKGAFLNAAVFASKLLGIHVTEVPDLARYRGEYVERLGNAAWEFVKNLQGAN